MQRAEDIYEKMEERDVNIFSDEEMNTIFHQIIGSEGDVALTLALARQNGWFTKNDEELCDTIRKSNGNVALAILVAKNGGWWDQDDATTCKTILNTEGTQDWVIYNAKEKGWWVEPLTDFYVFWLNGELDVIKGTTISDAFMKAGYGGSAVNAIDFYAESKEEVEKYEYCRTKHRWYRK
jgi:hypothetical protein